jgi:regulatory protein
MPSITKEQALQKLMHYCAYQERCHNEVREKLFQLGAWKKDHDEIIATLISENYLNEERFAIAFAGGKWRTKRWGRLKIKRALQQKGLSAYCIAKGLKEIGEDEYDRTIIELARKKYAALKNLQYLVRKKRTIDFLVGKGFETDRILSLLRKEFEKGK